MQNTSNMIFSIMQGSKYKLIYIVVLFLTLSGNSEFFSKTLLVYPLTTNNFGFLFSLVLVIFLLNVLIFTLLSSKWTIKPVLILVIIVSSMSSYFMNTYHMIIDDSMVQNIVQTNVSEAMDLFSIEQVLYFLFLGVLPSLFVYRYNIVNASLKREILSKIVIVFVTLLSIFAMIFVFSKHYTSFFREHKPLRYYVNPSYWIYSTGKYIGMNLSSSDSTIKPICEDVKIVKDETKPKKIVIMVVGEAARADRFSLNGYSRHTNPRLEKEDILNFPEMYSCGTSTAVSVPCMFSVYDRDDYSYNKAASTQNILDVLYSTNKVSILWRDNNSDSKGVALRVPYENYRSPSVNPVCDEECRDEGMIIGLDKYIDEHKDKDILIILHQMGNHGPAYYKRYPKEFEKFKPVCKTNQLETCTQEEISNAYDNAILYTDYFLSKVIEFLKKYEHSHETAMIYMSDHGESLGENGIYLHGLPYFMAPQEQKHVGSLMWFGEKMKKDLNVQQIKKNTKQKYSQDNLFYTFLGLFEAQTEVYDKKMDILHNNK